MTQATINPLAMTIEEAVRLLSAAGRIVTPEMIQAAIDAGAPVLAGDGKHVNLIDLMAFLEKNIDRK